MLVQVGILARRYRAQFADGRRFSLAHQVTFIALELAPAYNNSQWGVKEVGSHGRGVLEGRLARQSSNC